MIEDNRCGGLAVELQRIEGLPLVEAGSAHVRVVKAVVCAGDVGLDGKVVGRDTVRVLGHGSELDLDASGEVGQIGIEFFLLLGSPSVILSVEMLYRSRKVC